jgi:hypothetical protein
MQKIERIAELRAVQNDKRTAEFVISTESIDRHGTVFELGGWDLTDYQRNPIVCYNHDASGSDPDTIIGTSEVFVEGEFLIGRAIFEPEGENKIADKVWRKLKNGTLRMASVGAIPHEARWGDTNRGEDSGTLYFTRQELLEWSIVSAGSNRDAHKRNTEDTDKLKEQFKTEPKGMSLETKAKLRAIKKVKINTINLI